MDTLVAIHSGLRWVVLAALLAAVVYAIVSAIRRDAWSPAAGRAFLIVVVLFDIQVAVGIVLWFGTQAWESNPFYAAIHPLAMLLALVVAHVTLRRARSADGQGFWIAGLGLLAALAIVIGAIPWAA